METKSGWVGKLFSLPPIERRKLPDFLLASRSKGKPVTAMAYIMYLVAKTGFLLTWFFGILYCVSGVSRTSFNLGFFSIKMPPRDFIYYFVDEFSLHVPGVLFATSVYFWPLILINVPSYGNLSDQSRKLGRSTSDLLLTTPIIILMAVAVPYCAFGLPRLFLDMTWPSIRTALANSNTFLIFLTAFYSVANATALLLFMFYSLGLLYYFPKSLWDNKQRKSSSDD